MKPFSTAEESLRHFKWRSEQYLDYLKLMPVEGRDNLTVLDYGCGPGNDLIGFACYSRPKKLIGADVSPLALGIAQDRLKLHSKDVEFFKIDEKNTRIDIATASIDLIHSSGVLHHVFNLQLTLRELHRLLKVDGELRVMVYNKNSLWFHLNAGYLERKKHSDFPRSQNDEEIFKTTTDGRECPIANCYEPQDFISLVMKEGFSSGRYLGAAISMDELAIMNSRFEAIKDIRLDPSHRKFLLDLLIDERGIPQCDGVNAGFAACYIFKK